MISLIALMVSGFLYYYFTILFIPKNKFLLVINQWVSNLDHMKIYKINRNEYDIKS